MNYLDGTIKEIHDALLNGLVTPLELTKEAIKRAKEEDCNSFEYISEKEAFEAISHLDEKDKNNPFWGIPFVTKDNFSTKGIPTTASSHILEGYVPVFDAEVYRKLLNAGAIPIGKTTLDELAMGGSGTTGHKGITYNPWDKKHQSHIGGSSCGSAACCALGIVPFALGSDTGDSARKPASYAGLVGFKPTWGRVSRFGLFPFACSLDSVGYFTRSVYDSSLALSIIAGRDEKDMTSSLLPVEDYASYSEDLHGVKFAVIKEILDSITDLEMHKVFNKSLDYLKEKGAIIDYVSMDIRLCKAVYPTYITISCAEATSNNANLDGIRFGKREDGKTYQDIVINTRSKNFSKPIKRRFIIGSYSLLRDNQQDTFIRARKCRRLIADAVNNILKDYDAIYLPAAPSIAPSFSTVTNRLSDEYLLADSHLEIANLAGLPSIVLPIGFENGMPLGVTFMGRLFDEKRLFGFAQNVENFSGLKNIKVEK